MLGNRLNCGEKSWAVLHLGSGINLCGSCGCQYEPGNSQVVAEKESEFGSSCEGCEDELEPSGIESRHDLRFAKARVARRSLNGHIATY